MQKTNKTAFFTELAANPEPPNAVAQAVIPLPVVTPTRPGIMYLVVNGILLLTAINYSNHNILIVALFLLSLFVVSLVMAWRYFRGLELALGEVRPVFAGQDAYLAVNIKFNHCGDSLPLEMKVELDPGEPVVHATRVATDKPSVAQIPLTPGKRGRYNLIKLQISSTFPFGLFRIRRSLAVGQTFWVYANPAEDTTQRKSRNAGSGDEPGEGILLRQYRVGDPVRRIHKKSLAMGQNILVKDVEAQTSDMHWLQWDSLPELGNEQRLQTLTRRVLEAEQRGSPYGLSLPNGKINPAAGEAHKHQCLRMLAEYQA